MRSSRFLLRSPLRSIIRVDLAGETAAVRICQTHLWFYPNNPVIMEILKEEEDHLAIMQDWIRTVRGRPSILDPVFYAASVGMGAVTAILGPNAVMCCHAAIEDTIAAHYDDQLRDLHAMSPEEQHVNTLRGVIKKLRDDELHHHDLGMQNGAEKAPLYPVLYGAIQAACNVGIWLAKRL
eukprot:PhF_6_TR19830/c0_g1_i1/m.28911/K06134/COQ7; ubiquinone biosynthesis monooxygenase Coq7